MNMFLPVGGTSQHVHALARCSATDMAQLRDLFETTMQETLVALAKAEEPHRIYRLQGRVEAMKDFMEAVEQANSILERTR